MPMSEQWGLSTAKFIKDVASGHPNLLISTSYYADHILVTLNEATGLCWVGSFRVYDDRVIAKGRQRSGIDLKVASPDLVNIINTHIDLWLEDIKPIVYAKSRRLGDYV